MRPTCIKSTSTPQGSRVSSRGFTLVELVASMLSAAILILGLMSSLYIASQSTDVTRTPAPSALKTSRIAEQVVNELNSATGFTVTDANTIQFTVPDRDNNGGDETIRYEWSGTAGDSLQRKLNSGDLFDFAKNVHAFNLDYETYPVTTGAETKTYLARITITLQVSEFATAAMTASCQILNQPELGP